MYIFPVESSKTYLIYVALVTSAILFLWAQFVSVWDFLFLFIAHFSVFLSVAVYYWRRISHQNRSLIWLNHRWYLKLDADLDAITSIKKVYLSPQLILIKLMVSGRCFHLVYSIDSVGEVSFRLLSRLLNPLSETAQK